MLYIAVTSNCEMKLSVIVASKNIHAIKRIILVAVVDRNRQRLLNVSNVIG